MYFRAIESNVTKCSKVKKPCATISLPTRRPNILASDDNVIEVDDVGWVFGPAIGDIGLERERVGFKRGGLAPVYAVPMAKQTAIDPTGLLPIGLAGSVLFQHELGANPAALADHLLRLGKERVAPEFAIRRRLHLVPVTVKIPFLWRRPARPVSQRFERC